MTWWERLPLITGRRPWCRTWSQGITWTTTCSKASEQGLTTRELWSWKATTPSSCLSAWDLWSYVELGTVEPCWYLKKITEKWRLSLVELVTVEHLRDWEPRRSSLTVPLLDFPFGGDTHHFKTNQTMIGCPTNCIIDIIDYIYIHVWYRKVWYGMAWHGMYVCVYLCVCVYSNMLNVRNWHNSGAKSTNGIQWWCASELVCGYRPWFVFL